MMGRFAVLLSLALPSGALACPDVPSDAIPLVSQVANAPMAYAQMDAPPLSAPFAMTISFCHSEQEANELSFDAIMPAHRHGMNFKADVTKMADNKFEVSNVVFHMPGLWDIQIEAAFAGQNYAYSAGVRLK